MFVSLKIQQSADKSIDKKSIFVSATIHDAMITPEEYEKRVKSPITDEDDDMKLPIPAVVIIVVISSLIGIFIICKAILGL